jgi:biotin carboxyl carrier protein
VRTRVFIDGRPIDVELSWEGEECRFRFEGDGREGTASILEVEPGIYSVLLDGRSFEVRMEPGQGAQIAAVQGRRLTVEVDDPRRPRRRAAGTLREGRATVSAPMPGKVVRVLAAEGDLVEAGQGLLVVEAMKMQNEVKSPKAGRVAALAAREGGAVAAGDVLAVIE